MAAGVMWEEPGEGEPAAPVPLTAEVVLMGLQPPPAPERPDEPEPILDPERWLPKVARTTWAKVARARGWLASNRAVAGLREVNDPQALLAGFAELLARPQLNVVVRQNAIFHIALALPPEVAEPWLSEAAVRPADAAWTEADREDVLVARAFAGYGDAVIDFEALARAPAVADVHRLVDRMEALEGIGNGGTPEARHVLRSYHAIEVMDREPYFKMLGVYVRLPWKHRGWADVGTGVRERLHLAWLARYRGHPGSDDVALRMGRDHFAALRFEEAATWLAKATNLPDTDVTHSALAGLIALAELYLSPAQLESMAFLDGTESPNHQLLLYIRARRLAAEHSFEAGLSAFEDAVRAGDTPALERAWRSRWHAAPPRGLTSGTQPLLRPERLLTQEQEPDLPELELDPIERGMRDASDRRDWDAWWDYRKQGRLNPQREARGLGEEALARQLRLWETLAELERRLRHARGADRADLLYKQAAVLYHQRNALRPVYSGVGYSFGWLLRGPHDSDASRFQQAVWRYRRTSMGSRRALALFEQIQREHPRWEGMDQVLFSQGLAWRKQVDEVARYIWTRESPTRNLRKEAVRRLVHSMEATAARYPKSTLADDALRAAGYWRSIRRYGMPR